MSALSYYSHPQVRARMVEFLGGDSLETVSCHHLTVGDAGDPLNRRPLPVSDLSVLLDRESDICRSLWDRESLIADLDIEYVNFDDASEAFLEPGRIFDLQHPVERTVEELLLSFDIVPLHCLSGRGHHFVWRIQQDSPVFDSLARLGRVSPSLSQISARPHAPDGQPVSPKLAAAFAGLGLVMEYLAHCVKALVSPLCEIPVELTAVEVGRGPHGREMISLDISEYGDPLACRTLRIPFSHYLKPLYQRGLLGEETLKNLPPLFCIPLHEIDSHQGLLVMRDAQMTADLAAHASVKIPDQTQGMKNLLAQYQTSSLAKFHEWFYSVEHDAAERWPQTYDQTPIGPLPLCVRTILANPNDLLLRPCNIRLVTRVLLSLGWHPRHISGLIRSKFERNYHWGNQWLDGDPATRADFYTRIFSGLFVTGHDDLVDFNCKSSQEEKTCLVTNCPFNLESYRQSALTRRKYEYLAHRPFNRLLLSEQHS